MPARTARSGSPKPGPLPELYSARELAAAAGVSTSIVRQLIASADIPTVDGEFVLQGDALQAARGLRGGHLTVYLPVARPGVLGGALLSRDMADRRSQGFSALASTTLHLGVILSVALLTTVSLTTASDDADSDRPQLGRLIFIAEPGPGGGGGGGGLWMPEPPPAAERRGARTVSSPVPERITPKRIEPAVEPEERPLRADPLPRILAPVLAAAADRRNIRGLRHDADPVPSESSGPGIDGGVGTGSGTGLDSGRGAGLGPGTGGGFGGGAYRPGSGISPPRLIHEERPRYTEDARQRGITGDVLLEIIVLRDGSVGDVRLLRRLGGGLDEQAIQAVRQWRFSPAEKSGTPVDVVVEVAVEFNLR